MIGRKSHRKADAKEAVAPRGFDAFELRLGDVMRGERATLGKSLLDVQRELRIKASYIAAIENCDPSAFETPGFIAGSVRSYARYLNMDPDDTFAAFCAESGFSTAHGMSAQASSRTRVEQVAARNRNAAAAAGPRDLFNEPRLPFAPAGDSLLSRIEPAAIGSSLVLLALIAGIGYGGWTVLKEVQRVQLAPVDRTPVVLSDLDPLQAATAPAAATAETEDAATPAIATLDAPVRNDSLDRLYRPQALDVPVLTARDAPISTLDPNAQGAFASNEPPALPELDTDSAVQQALAQLLAEAKGETLQLADLGEDAQNQPKVLEDGRPGVTIVAARPAWVRVSSADGSSLFEATLNAGDTYTVPQLAEAPTIRIGESGAIYFAVNGQTYGPAGSRGQLTKNLALSVENLTSTYAAAEIGRDPELERAVAALDGIYMGAGPAD